MPLVSLGSGFRRLHYGGNLCYSVTRQTRIRSAQGTKSVKESLERDAGTRVASDVSSTESTHLNSFMYSVLPDYDDELTTLGAAYIHAYGVRGMATMQGCDSAHRFVFLLLRFDPLPVAPATGPDLLTTRHQNWC